MSHLSLGSLNRFVVARMYSHLPGVKRLALSIKSCAPPRMTTATDLCLKSPLPGVTSFA